MERLGGPTQRMDGEALPHAVDVARGIADVLKIRPEHVLPISSVEAGFRTVLLSWQRHRRLGPEHKALCMSIALESTKVLLRGLSANCGVRVKETSVEFPLDSEEVVLDALEQDLSSDTELVVLEALPARAPFTFPLSEAIDLCRQHAPHALVIVDARGPGGFALLPSSQPDVFLADCSGLDGACLMHVAAQHHQWIKPLDDDGTLASGLAVDNFYRHPVGDATVWLAQDAALHFWDAAGPEAARTYARYLALDAAEMLVDAWDTELGFSSELMGSMAMVELPKFPWRDDSVDAEGAEQLQQAFAVRSIEVPVCALSGKLFVHVSAEIYHEVEDFEPLRDVVLEMLECL